MCNACACVSERDGSWQLATPFCPTLESGFSLRGRPAVVAENAAHSLPAASSASRWLPKRTIDQLVRESLVIALTMIGRGEFVQRLSEAPLTERHDAVQALLFTDRTNGSAYALPSEGRTPAIVKRPTECPRCFKAPALRP